MTRRMTLLLTVVALVALGFASPALAAPGDLDTTFGKSGTVVTRFSDFSPGDDLAIQRDGKVVVAGGNFLARYNPDGTLDSSFDGDGKAVGGGSDIAVQSDGKVVVVGQTSRRNSAGQLDFDFQVLRYNADGSPDATFSGDGKLTTSVGPGNAFDSAADVVVQPDGQIVVAGYSHDYNNDSDPSAGGADDFALVRYNSDGSLDLSFDTDGKLTTDLGSDTDRATALALQGDGKIVAAGFAYNDAGNSDVALARYNSDGSLDGSFDGDGKRTTVIRAGNDWVSALAIQDDGKILAAGNSEAVQPKVLDFALARYNPDGSLDASFHGDGRLTTSIGSLNDDLGDVVLQPDGKIMAVGKTTVDRDGLNRNWELVLARYNPNGSLDPLFGGDGKASGPEVNPQNVAAGLQASGKILVSSTSTDQGQLLARFYGGDDATPPATTINSGPLGFVRSTSASFGFSSSEPGSSFECSLDGAAYSRCVSPKSYSALTNGSHTFRVRATDANSNTDPTPASRTWTVDTVVPRGTISINDGDVSTASRSVTLRLSTSDPAPASGVASMRFKNNGTTTWSAWQTYATSKSWTLSSGTGTKTVYVQYQDRAGNVSAAATDSITYQP